MIAFVKKNSWKNILLLGLLLLFEVSIHPLGFGPDRKIHDPAVYRLDDSTYLSGDWYTEMSLESGVYPFYAKLVNMWHILPLSEEPWRLLLYIASIIVLYVSLIRISTLFSASIFIVPIVAIFHAIVMLTAPPIWLYGPFMQIDGGLAPRSIGMALSFLSLFFLLKGARILPWAILGIATLIHVSNSLIVFTLFFLVWIGMQFHFNGFFEKRYWLGLIRKSFASLAVYILAGGWFALFVAFQHKDGVGMLPTEKFIWTWIYFRAPYMALPLMPWKAWLLFGLHIASLFFAWYFLRQRFRDERRVMLDFLGLIGVGAVVYFFLFYVFAFILPWMPGFQFYSIRVIYFLHFSAYLFTALLLVLWCRDWMVGKFFFGKNIKNAYLRGVLLGSAVSIILIVLFYSYPGRKFFQQSVPNIRASWDRVANSESRKLRVSQSPVDRYLIANQKPFLAPPNWYGSASYLPSVASFKTFGFTMPGMAEWYTRMNDVSRGDLERTFQLQRQSGHFEAVTIDWRTVYSGLSVSDILLLAEKYNFKLFLSYGNLAYPFVVVAKDADYVLYRVSQ